MSRMGANTAMSERLMEITVKDISAPPRRAASSGSMPSSRWRMMFSVITTASSTTKPVATVSAISERLSMENPSRYMGPKLPMMETGTARPGISVARGARRKTNTTPTTSSTAMTRLFSVSSTAARMDWLRSMARLTCTAGGSAARKAGSSALMASTVRMIFASGVAWMITSTAALPL